MVDPRSLTLPYRAYRLHGPVPRPYVVMDVTGFNERRGPVLGLIDSGADSTCLPMGYAALMGYTPLTLKPEGSMTAAGSSAALRALEPSTMRVAGWDGSPDITIYPLFAPGSQMPLWGRADFMAAFDVAIMQRRQQFTIALHEHDEGT